MVAAGSIIESLIDFSSNGLKALTKGKQYKVSRIQFDGATIVIGDDAREWALLSTEFREIIPIGPSALWPEGIFRIPETKSSETKKHKCRCDFRSVIMVAGCKCGGT